MKEEKSEMLLKIETKGNFVADGRRIEFDIMKISRDRSKPNNWNITVSLSDFLGEVEIPLDIDSAGLYNSINNFVRDKVKLVFENQVKPNASLLEKIKTEVGRIHEIQID